MEVTKSLKKVKFNPKENKMTKTTGVEKQCLRRKLRSQSLTRKQARAKSNRKKMTGRRKRRFRRSNRRKRQ